MCATKTCLVRSLSWSYQKQGFPSQLPFLYETKGLVGPCQSFFWYDNGNGFKRHIVVAHTWNVFHYFGCPPVRSRMKPSRNGSDAFVQPSSCNYKWPPFLWTVPYLDMMEAQMGPIIAHWWQRVVGKIEVIWLGIGCGLHTFDVLLVGYDEGKWLFAFWSKEHLGWEMEFAWFVTEYIVVKKRNKGTFQPKTGQGDGGCRKLALCGAFCATSN